MSSQRQKRRVCSAFLLSFETAHRETKARLGGAHASTRVHLQFIHQFQVKSQQVNCGLFSWITVLIARCVAWRAE